MRKTSALPIRLDADIKESLARIADSTGISTSALVRMLVKSFVDAYEQGGGQVTIPPRWHTHAAYADREEQTPALKKAAESRGTYPRR